MDKFFEAVFKESSPVFNDCFLYLLDKFIANDKTSYPLTYFLFLGSIEYCLFLFINQQSQIN